MSSSRSTSFSGSYVSSDHEHGNVGHGTMEVDWLPASNGQSVYQQHKPYSDQKHINGKKAQKYKRPTHFLCFPLVTDSSILQLSKSLQRFREVTTATPQSRANGTKAIVDEMVTPERDGMAEDAVVVQETATAADKVGTANLRVIPASAYRPPGTFHLTIGAMDLSEKSAMQKAISLLNSIDFESTLESVESSITQSSVIARPQREVAMDTSRPETSNSSSSTLNANQTLRKSPETNLYGQAGYRETVSRVDRAILHATPNTSSMSPNRGPDSYRDTVSRVDRAVMSATPDPPSMRQQKQANINGHTNGHTNGNHTSNPLRPVATINGGTPNDFGKTSHLRGPSTSSSNIYGQSGYKETVSTIDRYVDKTYDKAHKVKQMVQLKKGPLKSLKREVSPPASVGSRQRLLSLDSRDDGGSLYTTTSAGTARPEVGGRATEAADVTKAAAANNAVPEQEVLRPKQVPKAQPLSVTLKGIGAFSSPRKARVFYAPPVDSDGRLLALANAIRQVFKDEGLITEDRELVLHATIANMTYATKGKSGRRGGKGEGRGRGRPETVDGSEVVRYFNGEAGEGGYVWAKDVKIDRMRICKMGAVKSEDEVLGMVYPAIEVELPLEESEGSESVNMNGNSKAIEKEKAEVVFA